MSEHQALVRKISRSQILSDYEIAFVNASGLPLRFQPVGNTEAGDWPLSQAGDWPLSQAGDWPLRHHRAENAFCALLSKMEAGCKMCSDVEGKLLASDGPEARTQECLAGLVDTAVPVMVRGRLAGYLRTGQVALVKRKKKDFARVARALVKWGLGDDIHRFDQMKQAWVGSKVISPTQHEAFIHLLKDFARHIGLAAEQFPPESEGQESPLIQKARQFIAAHQQEELGVRDVAKALNMSVFYFCKVFRKATGKTFTQYLSEVRVAKAKKLLLNPHLRISEVAFEAGFQSITHFNRIFRKLTGQSPSGFRETAQ